MNARRKYWAMIVTGGLLFASSAFPQTGNGQPKWQRLETDTGAVYQVDLNSIYHFPNGTAEIIAYSAQGPGYNPENMRRLWFDCQGRFRDQTVRAGPTQYAAPRSLAGRISEIACADSKSSLLEVAPKAQPQNRVPEYCSGFDPSSCERIKEAVAEKQKPLYCKPGFERDQSRLSIEQIRICSVVVGKQTQLKSKEPTPSPAERPQNDAYYLKLVATPSKFPNIVGSTNFPDGTKLLVSINKPRLPNAGELLSAGLSMCEENCLPASGPKGETLGTPTAVLSGAFSAGPFSWNGKPFRQGSFEVEIYLNLLPGESDIGVENLNRQSERMKAPIFKTFVAVAPPQ